jgi:zeaxanthin glucosyltransferase
MSSVADLTRTLRRLLAEPDFSARMAPLSDAIRVAGGAPRAADIIETALHLPTAVASHG